MKQVDLIDNEVKELDSLFKIANMVTLLWELDKAWEL